MPALDTDAGTDYIGKPPGFGLRMREEYTAKDYHKVSDEIKPDWDLSGAVEDLQLLFQVGYRVAQSKQLPEWKPGRSPARQPGITKISATFVEQPRR